MLERVAQSVGRDGGGAPPAPPWPWRVLLLGGAGLALTLALRAVRRRRGGAVRHGAATRAYLQLRRAYSRRGLAEVAGPPLAFVQALRRAGAPGAEDAAAAVAIYTSTRFAGRPLDVAQRAALRAHVRQARAAVRAAKRATRWRAGRG